MSDISKDKLADELERAEQARRIILSDIRNQYESRIMEIERNSENAQNQLREALDSVVNSGTWKLMEPVRQCIGVLRRKKNKKRLGSDGDQISSSSRTDENRKAFSLTTEREYVEKKGNASESIPGDVKHIAFYSPKVSAFPENEKLSRYDSSEKNCLQKQIELAKFYGIYGFCFYYYWFDGKKIMETPLEIIMHNPDMNLPFCLCWANENLTQNIEGKEQETLIEQTYGEGFAENFICDACKYMKDGRYIKIAGKPLLIVNSASNIPRIEKTISTWRRYFRDNGIGEIQIFAVANNLTTREKVSGFDGFIEFPTYLINGMSLVNQNPELTSLDYEGGLCDYRDIVKLKEYLTTSVEKVYKGIFLAWDNPASTKSGNVSHNYSPKYFREWLFDINKYTRDNFEDNNRFVFINAWNDCGSGSYLEPDKKYGYAALDSVREVLTEIRGLPNRKIIYVGHDACKGGSQLLSIEIVRQLHEVFEYDVYVILKTGGELIEKFEKHAAKILCMDKDVFIDNDLLRWINSTRASKAICNTVVTGDVLELLSESGICCISLIHEMENVIRKFKWERYLSAIANNAEKIVFASGFVMNSAENVYPIPKSKVEIVPQGMYLANPYLENRDSVRSSIRDRYGIPQESLIVLNVGNGERNKGIDLFAKCVRSVCSAKNDVYFVWVGPISQEIRECVSEISDESGRESRLVLPGWQDDVMPFYVASDLFLLTSREDSYPTVVMEALNASLPVIAFEGGGGYVELVNDSTGILVPMEDTDAMSEQVLRYLSDNNRRISLGTSAHDYVEDKLNFTKYVEQLLLLLP